MFCKNCGISIHDHETVCPHCGAQQSVQPLYVQNQPVPAKNTASEATNIFAVVGFILSFFISIAGLVCSIIGYKNASRYDDNGKGLATAGIIISVIGLSGAIILYITVFTALGIL